MVIRRLGHSAFKIRGGSVSVITDPFSDSIGIKFPRISSDIVTVSHHHSDHDNVAGIENFPFVVDGPGDYQIKGVRIHGINSFHDNKEGAERGKNVLYFYHIDGISLLHCGDLGHSLNKDHLQIVEEIDILFIPVGGVYTIDAKTAVQTVTQLEPRIIIPMHYYEKRLNQEIFAKLQKVDDFLKELGKREVQPQDKLTISKSQLPEETEVVVLK